jgi:D-aminopeptidase
MAAARDFGLGVGRLAPGPNNAITDVPGVLIGHKTIIAGGLATGVTAVLPHGGDLFQSKVRAAVEVINGFGKSAGLMQVAELGTIETPILLTNTFSVAPCVETLIRRAIAANPEIGRETSTVNPVVCECNDGGINDIQAMAVTPQDAEAALDAASAGPVAQGSVGAGT